MLVLRAGLVPHSDSCGFVPPKMPVYGIRSRMGLWGAELPKHWAVFGRTMLTGCLGSLSAPHRNPVQSPETHRVV